MVSKLETRFLPIFLIQFLYIYICIQKQQQYQLRKDAYQTGVNKRKRPRQICVDICWKCLSMIIMCKCDYWDGVVGWRGVEGRVMCERLYLIWVWMMCGDGDAFCKQKLNQTKPNNNIISSIESNILQKLILIINPVQKMSQPMILFAQLAIVNKTLANQLQKPILINIFHHQQQDIQLTLTDHHIFIHQLKQLHTPTHYLTLDFNVKFEVLFSTHHQIQTNSKIQIPSAIKFEAQACSQQLTFKASHPSVVETWALELEKRINQRNFHKLFKAKKKIGKGAFATVYLAERLRDNKLVAVKAFSKQKQYESDKGKQSLVNEIKIMRKLNHRNLMKLQGVYQTENSIYIILEYLQGMQLNEFLKQNKALQLLQIKQIMRNLLRGLSHLAKSNIIHRDIKPQNIMFKMEGQMDLAICDFGLATYADEDKYLFVRCGTPGFVAPEIINIKDLSTKSSPISDVFSAGIIFHHLLFGFSMFEGKKYNQILTQNRLCDFHFNKEIYSKLSFPIFDLLTKMLQVDPAKRVSVDNALNHSYFSSQMEIQLQEAETGHLSKESGKTKVTLGGSSLLKYVCPRQKDNIEYMQICSSDQHYFIYS